MRINHHVWWVEENIIQKKKHLLIAIYNSVFNPPVALDPSSLHNSGVKSSGLAPCHLQRYAGSHAV